MTLSLRGAGALLPGLLLSAAVLAVATPLSALLGALLLQLQGVSEAKGSPVSAISLAILTGLLVGNLVALHPVFKAGIQFAMRTVLRVGIVLVGLKLALGDVLQLGILAVPLVAVLIVVAMVATRWLARVLGVGERFGLLAAAATSICGVTATVAAAPVLEAEEREVTYAIAIVTLFGLIGMLTYPLLAHAVFGADSASAGMFLGTSIHDTSQVIGAALSYREIWGDDRAFEVATVTKLTRNLFIVVVIPVLGWIWSRKQSSGAGRETSLRKLVPGFVVGFVAMALIRSAGEWTLGSAGEAFGFVEADHWRGLVSLLGDRVSYLALGLAMAAVGLNTNIRSLRSLGLRPFWVGAGAALIVSGVGMALAHLV